MAPDLAEEVDQPMAPIPEWAHGGELARALAQQAETEPPFGEVPPFDFAAVFGVDPDREREAINRSRRVAESMRDHTKRIELVITAAEKLRGESGLKCVAPGCVYTVLATSADNVGNVARHYCKHAGVPHTELSLQLYFGSEYLDPFATFEQLGLFGRVDVTARRARSATKRRLS